jgi:WhiB family redox-sensing transcriptional regulator
VVDASRRPVRSADSQWQFYAACRGLGDDLFYTRNSERGPTKRRRESMAKSVCARCPVAEPCLSWALAAGERYGIWGGLTEAERVQFQVTAQAKLAT